MEITIYSTSACAACHTLTAWLEKEGFKYTKKVTDENPEFMAEFMNVNDGMIGVPFTIIKEADGKETKLSGFDPGKFKEVLACR